MSEQAEQLFGGSRVTLKDESSKYSTKRWDAKHPKLGAVIHPGTLEPCQSMSQLDKAKAGVFMKHVFRKSGVANCTMQEHEKALLEEMCMADDWTGTIDGKDYDRVPGGEMVKNLVDDATSGGLEIVPVVVDQNIITYPLLEGELLPRVDIIDLSRGRRVEGGSISNISVQWGDEDGDVIDQFDTTGMVNAFDTNIHSCTTSITAGNDFISDSPIRVGELLTRLMGQRLRSDLDRVVASGNGITEPVGITSATGVTLVNTANGASGPSTLGDHANLLFSVPKEYRLPSAANGCCYISNDVQFGRSRAVGVGSDDARPLLTGGAVDAGYHRYSTLGFDHCIENTSLPNTTTIFACMKLYRMYRRLGFSIRVEKGGRDLALKNLSLLIMRSRWGGQITDGTGFAIWTDGQT